MVSCEVSSNSSAREFCKMFRVKLIKQLLGLIMCLACCMTVSTFLQFITEMVFTRSDRRWDAGNSELPFRMMPKARPQQHKENRRGLINVRELCKLESFEDESAYEYGRMMKNRSIYYCYIPKCGTTFMEVFLAKLFSNKDSNRSYYTEITEKEVLEDSYAFTFVREPYGRLFSAYENKFFHPNEMWKKLGTDVIRVVRPDATSMSRLIGHDVTFTELVKYVVTLHERQIPLNPHLAPMKSICDPCKKRFDFIGRLETMTDDLVYLVDQWKYRDIVPQDMTAVVNIESETKYSRNFGRIYHMFDTLRKYKTLLSRNKMFERTWSSYQMRGVILKKYKLPFSKSEIDLGQVDRIRYQHAVKEAIDSSQDFKDELKAQRQEALLQAYRTVPLDLMFKLREFVKTDCYLYGYDDKPDKLFVRSVLTDSDGHDYFKGL